MGVGSNKGEGAGGKVVKGKARRRGGRKVAVKKDERRGRGRGRRRVALVHGGLIRRTPPLRSGTEWAATTEAEEERRRKKKSEGA